MRHRAFMGWERRQFYRMLFCLGLLKHLLHCHKCV